MDLNLLNLKDSSSNTTGVLNFFSVFPMAKLGFGELNLISVVTDKKT